MCFDRYATDTYIACPVYLFSENYVVYSISVYVSNKRCVTELKLKHFLNSGQQSCVPLLSQRPQEKAPDDNKDTQWTVLSCANGPQTIY